MGGYKDHVGCNGRSGIALFCPGSGARIGACCLVYEEL